jgi:hypothetical protein
MGGHIVIERLQCKETRVRVVVNGKVHQVPGCDSQGCTVSDFERIVKGRWKTGYCEACAPNDVGCVDRIAFYE